MRRRPLCSLYLIILAAGFAWTGCATPGRELITDPHFQRGFELLEPTPGKIVPCDTLTWTEGQQEPAWQMVQWNSRFSLAGSEPQAVTGGGVLFEDAGKAVHVFPAESTLSDIVFEVRGRAEYGDCLRRPGEPWPNFLVQQRFAFPPRLAELNGLDLAISVRLLDLVRADLEDFDDDRHAAQFLMFLTIQNLEPTSPGYGDFFYFGIPMFDSRYRETELYARADFADPSQKFIYIPPSTEFLSVPTHDRTLVEVRCDVLPLLRNGIELAWERGFLPGSRDLVDYYVAGMNLGWEIPGTYDASMNVRDLSLRAR